MHIMRIKGEENEVPISNAKRYFIFVDTNILLDFYRARNEIALTLLEKLHAQRDHLIMTNQIEMEFKKNRHSVISESLGQLITMSSITVPAFLTQTRAVTTLKKRHKDVNDRIKSLRKKLKEVLANPTKRDEVYKHCQRLFLHRSALTLSENDTIANEITERANKRFSLGYPPRKKKDTSMGDAVNWEWILHCAKSSPSNCEFLIVSRDGDYGTEIDNEVYINDWLRQEFNNNVGNNKAIRLINRLSEALKLLNVEISESEEKEEDQMVASDSIFSLYSQMSNPINLNEYYHNTQLCSAALNQISDVFIPTGTDVIQAQRGIRSVIDSLNPDYIRQMQSFNYYCNRLIKNTSVSKGSDIRDDSDSTDENGSPDNEPDSPLPVSQDD